MLRGETVPVPQTAAKGSFTREAMKPVFSFAPSTAKKAEEETPVGEGVIRLEPFHVSETKVDPALVRYLDHERQLFEAGKPSFANGIWKTLNSSLRVGIMPYDYKFMRGGASVPGWNLLVVRF